MNMVSDQKGFVLKYPIVYLIMALAILYYGGQQETHYTLISPDGQKLSIVTLSKQGINITCPEGKIHEEVFSIPFSKPPKVLEVTTQHVFHKNDPFTESVYSISTENEYLLLEIRHYNEHLDYQLSSKLKSVLWNVNLASYVNHEGKWQTIWFGGSIR